MEFSSAQIALTAYLYKPKFRAKRGLNSYEGKFENFRNTAAPGIISDLGGGGFGWKDPAMTDFRA